MDLGDKLRNKSLAMRGQASELMKQIGILVLSLIKTFFTLIATSFNWVYYRLVIANYFRIWSYQTQIRLWLRYSALAAVSFSTLMLAGEISLEFAGPQRLVQLFSWTNDPRVIAVIERIRHSRLVALFWMPDSVHLARIILVVLLAASTAYLTWHNIEEARKPGHEYQFARGVNSFLIDCRIAHDNSQPVPVLKALQVCHFIFKHSGIRHVALHLVESGTLCVRSEHIYPSTDEFSAVRLQPGEGVAGEVYAQHQSGRRIQVTEEKSMNQKTDNTESSTVSQPSGPVKLTPKSITIDLNAQLRPHLDEGAIARGWELFKKAHEITTSS